MSVVPHPDALVILLVLVDLLSDRGGWVKLDSLTRSGPEAPDRRRVFESVAELERLGYCMPPGFGELTYVTRTGLNLARAAREALAEGVSLQRLDLAHLAPRLTRLPLAWS